MQPVIRAANEAVSDLARALRVSEVARAGAEKARDEAWKELKRRCACDFAPDPLGERKGPNPGPVMTCGYHTFGKSESERKLGESYERDLRKAEDRRDDAVRAAELLREDRDEALRHRDEAEAERDEYIKFQIDARKALGGYNDEMKSLAWCVEFLAASNEIGRNYVASIREALGAKDVLAPVDTIAAEVVAERDRLKARLAEIDRPVFKSEWEQLQSDLTTTRVQLDTTQEMLGAVLDAYRALRDAVVEEEGETLEDLVESPLVEGLVGYWE